MKQILLICAAMVLLGCGQKANVRTLIKRPNLIKEPKQPPAKPKVEPINAKLTPGMEAASKAHEAGNYREAARLYTVELAAEEAKPAPSWVQLSYLHNQLGLALDNAGLYDKALEHHQKALAIRLKQLGPEHPDVAISYNNIGLVHDNKGEYDKALEHYQKALAIQTLGPEHPYVADSSKQLGAGRQGLEHYQKALAIQLQQHRGHQLQQHRGVHDNKGEYDKALEHYQKALAIDLKQLGPEHPLWPSVH